MEKEELHKSKQLNVWMLTALVTGTMIGSGIFTLPSNLAAFGTISILAWIFTAAGAVLLAYIFAKLSVLIPKAGGPYAYCREAWGDFIGFEVAYNYWIALCVGNAAIVVTCVGYLAEFFPILNQHAWLAFGIKASFIWLITIINLFGVRNASILQIVTVVLKLLPLFIIGLVGIFFIKPHHYHTFNISHQSNLSALGTTATLTLWSFIGLEAATVPDGQTTNKNSIAKGTMIGTLVAASVNILCIVVIMGLIPVKNLAHSTAPFTDAAKLLFPGYAQFMGGIITLGAIVACLGTLNSSILLQAQVARASAGDQLFPRLFAKENRYGAPALGLIISGLFITLLLLLTVNDGLLHQFQMMILMATLASLIPYLFTALGAIMLTKKYRHQFTTSEHSRMIIIAGVASVYSLWAILSSGFDILLYGGILSVLGIPIYLKMRYIPSEKHTSVSQSLA